MRVSRILLLLVALIAGGLAAFLATRGGGQPDTPAEPTVVQEARAQILVAKTGDRYRRAALGPESRMAGLAGGRAALRIHHRRRDARSHHRHEGRCRWLPLRVLPGRADPAGQARQVRSGLSVGGARQGHARRLDFGGCVRGLGRLHSPQRPCRRHPHAPVGRGADVGDHPQQCTGAGDQHPAGRDRQDRRAPDDGSDPNEPILQGADVCQHRHRDAARLDPSQQGETVVNAAALGKLSLALRSVIDFTPQPGDNDNQRRNAPIRLIRYGVEDNVMAGQATSAGRQRRRRNGDTPVDPAAYFAPARDRDHSTPSPAAVD